MIEKFWLFGFIHRVAGLEALRNGLWDEDVTLYELGFKKEVWNFKSAIYHKRRLPRVVVGFPNDWNDSSSLWFSGRQVSNDENESFQSDRETAESLLTIIL